MKHSDWDIWKKKLDELPVNSDEGLSWGAMQTMLDNNMPVATPPVDGSSVVKLILKKMVSALGYVLPAAAMVTAVTYFALKNPEPKVQHSKKKPRPDALLIPDSSKRESTIAEGTTKVMYHDSVRLSDKIQHVERPLPGKIAAITESSRFASAAESGMDSADTVAGRISYPRQLGVSSSYVKLSTRKTDEDFTEKVQGRLAQVDILEVSNRDKPIIKVNQDILTRHLDLEPNPNRRSKSKTKAVGINAPKVKKKKPAIEDSKGFSYGLETGINASNGYGTSIYFGAFTNRALNNKLLLTTGLRINTKRTLNGSYTHPSYNLNDPDAPLLRTIDSRKISTTDIPLQLEYRLSNRLSIKAGPVLTLQSKQSSADSKLDQIINHSDTVQHTKQLNEAMLNTQVNQVNAAFSGGIKFRLKNFHLEAGYLRNLNPYKVSSSLGAYQTSYSTFSVGIGYRFK